MARKWAKNGGGNFKFRAGGGGGFWGLNVGNEPGEEVLKKSFRRRLLGGKAGVGAKVDEQKNDKYTRG